MHSYPVRLKTTIRRNSNSRFRYTLWLNSPLSVLTVGSSLPELDSLLTRARTLATIYISLHKCILSRSASLFLSHPAATSRRHSSVLTWNLARQSRVLAPTLHLLHSGPIIFSRFISRVLSWIFFNMWHPIV